MRIAAVSSVVVAIVVALVVIGYASRGEAAQAPQATPSSVRAIAEADALQRAEASYYSQQGRYSERLADLFGATRLGSDIVMNAVGVDINLDVSTDGKTVIVRIDSLAIALSRVLVRGKETGRTCEAMAAGVTCP